MRCFGGVEGRIFVIPFGGSPGLPRGLMAYLVPPNGEEPPVRKVLSLALALVVLACSLSPGALAQQGPFNFPDRKAIVLDICPHVKITNFLFYNTLDDRRSQENIFTYDWKNVSNLPVLAFELVTLKYDPFDEPMLGLRTLIGGKNSADFRPLQPGEESHDGTSEYGHLHVLTAIVYVRAVRFTDGTTWRADPSVVAAEVKKAAPRIKDVGPLVPDRGKKDERKP
jgi:hypothetical protein